MEEYKFWLENDYFDQKTKEELKGIEGNNAEIEDRFYKDLEFGTGGPVSYTHLIYAWALLISCSSGMTGMTIISCATGCALMCWE